MEKADVTKNNTNKQFYMSLGFHVPIIVFWFFIFYLINYPLLKSKNPVNL